MPILYYKYTILWAFLILFLIGYPGSYLPTVPNFLSLFSPDKIVHLFLFGVFSFLLLHSIHKHKPTIKIGLHVCCTFFIGTIYGSLTEILQFYIFIGRNANPYDALANTIGVLIGILVFYRVIFFQLKK